MPRRCNRRIVLHVLGSAHTKFRNVYAGVDERFGA
jgi:hypothetical protein